MLKPVPLSQITSTSQNVLNIQSPEEVSAGLFEFRTRPLDFDGLTTDEGAVLSHFSRRNSKQDVAQDSPTGSVDITAEDTSRRVTPQMSASSLVSSNGNIDAAVKSMPSLAKSFNNLSFPRMSNKHAADTLSPDESGTLTQSQVLFGNKHKPAVSSALGGAKLSRIRTGTSDSVPFPSAPSSPVKAKDSLSIFNAKTKVQRRLSESNVNGRFSVSASSLPLTSPEEANMSIPLKAIKYPYLLSQLASEFQSSIVPGDHIKDNIVFSNSFSGRESVDVLCRLMGLPDRNLAVYVGKSFSLQKFITEVSYAGSFKDSATEFYRFTSDRIISSSNMFVLNAFKDMSLTIPNIVVDEDKSEVDVSITEENVLVRVPSPEVADAHDKRPTGVMISLLPCYSSKCGPSQSCYSFGCPSKTLMSTDKLAKVGRSRTISNANTDSMNQLWMQTVSKEVFDATPELERKRQEIVFEIVKTETEYVEDLRTLQIVYMDSLSRSDIIPKNIRTDFIKTVFGNLEQVKKINMALLDKLEEAQLAGKVVGDLGSTFESWSTTLAPYVVYGTNQVISKHFLDIELKNNLLLLKFCEANERRPECRKLPIQSFLSRPTTRLGRYPILLETLLNRSSSHSEEEKESLKTAINRIKSVLEQLNSHAGKADNSLRIKVICDSLIFKQGERVVEKLGLLDEKRRLIRDGLLKKRDGVEVIDLDVFLFDNSLILTRKKVASDGSIEYKGFKQPIPLYLLRLHDQEEAHSSGGSESLERSSTRLVSSRPTLNRSPLSSPTDTQPRNSFPFTIECLGRNGFQFSLLASSFADRKQWTEKIRDAIETMKLQMKTYEFKSILGYVPDVPDHVPGFLVNNPILSSLEHGKNIVIGTGDGVYVGTPGSAESFVKVLDFDRVSQMEIIKDFKVLLILSDKRLLSFPVEVLSNFSAADALASNNKKAKKLSGNASFFKVGKNYDRYYVAAIRTKLLTTYIKVFEKVGGAQGRRRSTFGSLLQRFATIPYDPEFSLFREIYIPSESKSIQFLKSKICVGCQQGFELVDLLSLETQALVDLSDPNFSFLAARESVTPVSLFKIENSDEFLLCYREFGIYVSATGRNARPPPPSEVATPHIQWLGLPESFASRDNKVMAFESSFVEIRTKDTGELVQLIPLPHLRNTLTVDGRIHASSERSVMSANHFPSRRSSAQTVSATPKRQSRSMSESSSAARGAETPTLTKLQTVESRPDIHGSRDSRNSLASPVMEEVRISDLHTIVLLDELDSRTSSLHSISEHTTSNTKLNLPKIFMTPAGEEDVIITRPRDQKVALVDPDQAPIDDEDLQHPSGSSTFTTSPKYLESQVSLKLGSNSNIATFELQEDSFQDELD